VQNCTSGTYTGTRYSGTDTPTIDACGQIARDGGFECFAYGTQEGDTGVVEGTDCTSDGVAANDCIMTNDCTFVTGWEDHCRWHVYGSGLTTTTSTTSTTTASSTTSETTTTTYTNYQAVQNCTPGTYTGRRYSGTDTPTIDACGQIARDGGFECFAYGTQEGDTGVVEGTNCTSDGVAANDCMMTNDCTFVTGWEEHCRWHVYSSGLTTTTTTAAPYIVGFNVATCPDGFDQLWGNQTDCVAACEYFQNAGLFSGRTCSSDVGYWADRMGAEWTAVAYCVLLFGMSGVAAWTNVDERNVRNDSSTIYGQVCRAASTTTVTTQVTWGNLSSGTTGRSASCDANCVDTDGCTDSDCLGWGLYCSSLGTQYTHLQGVSYEACEATCEANSSCYGFTSHGDGCGSGDNCYWWLAACTSYAVTDCGAGSYHYTKLKMGWNHADPF